MLFVVAFLGLVIARERGAALPVINSWGRMGCHRALLMSPQGPQMLDNAWLIARQ